MVLDRAPPDPLNLNLPITIPPPHPTPPTVCETLLDGSFCWKRRTSAYRTFSGWHTSAQQCLLMFPKVWAEEPLGAPIKHDHKIGDLKQQKCIFFSFLFLKQFSYGHTWGIWKFLGQGMNPSRSCNLPHSGSNAGSFTPLHCAGDQTKGGDEACSGKLSPTCSLGPEGRMPGAQDTTRNHENALIASVFGHNCGTSKFPG